MVSIGPRRNSREGGESEKRKQKTVADDKGEVVPDQWRNGPKKHEKQRMKKTLNTTVIWDRGGYRNRTKKQTEKKKTAPPIG